MLDVDFSADSEVIIEDCNPCEGNMATVLISGINDTLLEGQEFLTLNFSTSFDQFTGYDQIGFPSQLTCEISDDDGKDNRIEDSN